MAGCRFLLSTHYTHYDLTYFIINFLGVLAVVIPKLPFVCGLLLVLFLDVMGEVANHEVYVDASHEDWGVPADT